MLIVNLICYNEARTTHCFNVYVYTLRSFLEHYNSMKTFILRYQHILTLNAILCDKPTQSGLRKMIQGSQNNIFKTISLIFTSLLLRRYLTGPPFTASLLGLACTIFKILTHSSCIAALAKWDGMENIKNIVFRISLQILRCILVQTLSRPFLALTVCWSNPQLHLWLDVQGSRPVGMNLHPTLWSPAASKMSTSRMVSF